MKIISKTNVKHLLRLEWNVVLQKNTKLFTVQEYRIKYLHFQYKIKVSTFGRIHGLFFFFEKGPEKFQITKATKALKTKPIDFKGEA